MNILEELYYGNLRPVDKCFDRNSQYAKFVRIIGDNEEKMTAFLQALPETAEEQHLFSQLMNAQIELLEFSEKDRFIEGFQLGARFLLDALVLPQQSVLRDIS